MKGVVFREIIAIRDGKNHNAMKGRSLADFVTGRIKSAKEYLAWLAGMRRPLSALSGQWVIAVRLTQTILNFFDNLRGGDAVAIVEGRQGAG